MQDDPKATFGNFVASSLAELPAIVARSHSKGEQPNCLAAVAMKPMRYRQLASQGLFPCVPLHPGGPVFFGLRENATWHDQMPYDMLLHKVRGVGKKGGGQWAGKIVY